MTNLPSLELLPAVDVSEGRAVQLVQGIAGSGGQFGDPVEAALAWQEQGSKWLHLVDLDAAFGRGSNAELLAEIGQIDGIIGVKQANDENLAAIDELTARAVARGELLAADDFTIEERSPAQARGGIPARAPHRSRRLRPTAR